jgi:Raf kinase inhibitor-like YbhB/YbcL family protein
MVIRALALSAAGLVLVGCGGSTGAGGTVRTQAVEPTAPRTITVSSPAFSEGRAIPATYTCRGKGVSPPLQWSGVDGDRIGSLALVVDDPDAPGGDYVHWVVLGIPTGHGALDAGDLPAGATELEASGGPGWSPPCPPSGTHHYRFTVYAFPSDSAFAVSSTAPLDEVLATISDQAVAWGRLTGTVTAD